MWVWVLMLSIMQSSAEETTGRRSRPAWQAKLTTYSIASIARRQGRRDWNEVTQGNKIVLPHEVYDYLTSRGLPFDKFQLLNPERRKGLRLFTGPLDFCAASGECYLPSWVMKQLGIKEGESCAVATACFPAAAFIKFQPHSSDFLDIGDHTAVLTRTIENLGGLTQGSYVRVSDGKRTYTLDVLEVRGKPMPPAQCDDSGGRAVSIGLLECPIDFAEPKDISKKAKKKSNTPAADGAADGDGSSDGSGGGDGGGDGSGGSGSSAASGTSAAESGTSLPCPKFKAAKGGGSSAKAVGAEMGAAAAEVAAAPVPKFKRRKAADAGEAPPLDDSPFSGRARSLGSSRADTEAAGADSPADGPRRRAVGRKLKSVDGDDEASAAAAAEPITDAVDGSQPGLVLVIARVLSMLREFLITLLKALAKLLTPDHNR